ncbi:hypothetical protein RUND412_011317 [Rhizina undulata]
MTEEVIVLYMGKLSKLNFTALFVKNLDSSTEELSNSESEADVLLIVEENNRNLVDDESVSGYSKVRLVETKEEKPLAKIRYMPPLEYLRLYGDNAPFLHLAKGLDGMNVKIVDSKTGEEGGYKAWI